MIGFLVIAPKTLTDAQKAAALERVTSITQRVSDYNEAVEQLEQADEPHPSALLEQRTELLRDLGWSFEDIGEDPDVDRNTFYEQNDAFEQIGKIESDKFLEDLEAFLDGNARDTAWRPHPDNSDEVLLFCGGGSWGDEPDGLGYSVMKTITLLGLEATLGIR